MCLKVCSYYRCNFGVICLNEKRFPFLTNCMKILKLKSSRNLSLRGVVSMFISVRPLVPSCSLMYCKLLMGGEGESHFPERQMYDQILQRRLMSQLVSFTSDITSCKLLLHDNSLSYHIKQLIDTSGYFREKAVLRCG